MFHPCDLPTHYEAGADAVSKAWFHLLACRPTSINLKSGGYQGCCFCIVGCADKRTLILVCELLFKCGHDSLKIVINAHQLSRIGHIWNSSWEHQRALSHPLKTTAVYIFETLIGITDTTGHIWNSPRDHQYYRAYLELFYGSSTLQGIYGTLLGSTILQGIFGTLLGIINTTGHIWNSSREHNTAGYIWNSSRDHQYYRAYLKLF
ncbi:hypothetical protein CEXT_675771 [Caerostris extrusa]|uniref:Uncharacterized protein n=1 Tax=Caerostris extrusa TaxID=172846 RepID=A0AAV4PBB7_CAEEX|nr:hypothetical protein CEXT_675771 [Caerostris extrusa]